MTKGEAKKRGPRRGRGSITKNRAGNWQVRYTDPYGKRRAGGTYRLVSVGSYDRNQITDNWMKLLGSFSMPVAGRPISESRTKPGRFDVTNCGSRGEPRQGSEGVISFDCSSFVTHKQDPADRTKSQHEFSAVCAMWAY